MKENEPLLARLDTFQQRALVVGGIGVVLCVVGILAAGYEQFIRSYLFGFMFWLGLSLGSYGIYLLHHMVGGAWGFLIRRLLSAGARTLPLMAVLFLPVVFGITDLFPWARPGAAADPILHHKALYLNVPFFLIRAALYFAIWIGWSFMVFGQVKRLEETGELGLIRRMQNLSAGGLLLLFLTMTFAAFDWVMSLEPHWFSTIFGVQIIVGAVLSAICASTILLVFLAGYKPMSDMVRPQIFNDLGNLIFAFTMLWAYMSLSQFLIIYAGNLSEETPWYLHRINGGWEWIGLALVVFHFVIPFMILLSRKNKRNTTLLASMAAFLIVIRFFDLYWLIMPSWSQAKFHFHWLDLVTPLAIGGLWLWWFFWQLKGRPLLLTNDPRMQQALQTIDHKEPLQQPWTEAPQHGR